MKPLALNTVVRNEAHRIIGLLEHAAGYCDELIVVDQQSDDGTPDLARDFGATVVTDKCYGWAEPSRPLAQEHTTADWIIALDADETLAPGRSDELVEFPNQCMVAQLPVAALIDGVRTDPLLPDGNYHLNRQVRYFRRGLVGFGAYLHSRMIPQCSDEFIWALDGLWILNAKAMWEHELDVERYAYVAGIAEEMGVRW